MKFTQEMIYLHGLRLPWVPWNPFVFRHTMNEFTKLPKLAELYEFCLLWYLCHPTIEVPNGIIEMVWGSQNHLYIV